MFNVVNNVQNMLDKNKLMDCIKIYKEFKNSIINWHQTKLQETNKFINKCIDNPNKLDSVLKMFLIVLNNSNQIFNNQSLFVIGTKISKYYKKNKLIKTLNFKNRMYVIVTSVNDYGKALNDNISCPNCGAIIDI